MEQQRRMASALTVFINIVLLCGLCYSQGQNIPTVTLHNAAQPNTKMPVVRLGTGGYTHARSPEATPEVKYTSIYNK